jgi:membrane associated rhomboid family serine protease
MAQKRRIRKPGRLVLTALWVAVWCWIAYQIMDWLGVVAVVAASISGWIVAVSVNRFVRRNQPRNPRNSTDNGLILRIPYRTMLRLKLLDPPC